MSVHNIAGKWKGKIRFGNGYSDLARVSVLYFELDITQIGATIIGTAMDKGGYFPSPDPATIIGELKKDKLTFVKKYSSAHYLLDDQLIVDTSAEGPPIFYKGNYDAVRQIFAGTLDFEEEKPFWGAADSKSTIGCGTWEMERDI